MAQAVKNLPAMQETCVQSLLRNPPGEGNGYPLQQYCLDNSMDRGVWGTRAQWVTELDMAE